MYSYEEYCPISKTAGILGERWTTQILRELLFGSTRFSELQRFLPKLSPSLPTTRLQSLEDSGLLVREKVEGKKGFEYQLTPSGKNLMPVIQEMGKWGMSHFYDSLTENELDAEHLMRDIGMTIVPSALPDQETMICFDFRDLREKSRWFLKVSGGKSELCDGPTGEDLDVNIITTLSVFTQVWLGGMSLAAALSAGDMKVEALPIYTRRISEWLGLCPFVDHNPRYTGAATGS